MKYSELITLRKLREHIKIRIGEWKTKTDPDCGDGKSEESCDTTADILPKNVTIHEGYPRTSRNKLFENNIAIIEIGWPPRKSELINVVRLADSSRCEMDVAGEHWKTTGFGEMKRLKLMYIINYMMLCYLLRSDSRN